MITLGEYEDWKNNSIETASKLGYNSEFLGYCKKVKINLIKGKPKKVIFGSYNRGDGEVNVYSENISTQELFNLPILFRKRKVPNYLIQKAMDIINKIGKKEFYEIFNQSGMDHELIGHGYHFMLNQDRTEKTAVGAQLKLARARAGIIFGRNWRLMIKIMPVFLGYHKDIDELKS